MAGIVKSSSMFSSPEFVDGKVGVINSGKGMTSFSTRKKHQFDTEGL
jgi:survival-of-motor-neuron-related-splicing factor 30